MSQETAMPTAMQVPTLSPAPSSAQDTSMPTMAFPTAFNVVSVVPGSAPTAKDAEMTCAFENQWTSERHPNDYPIGAEWSPIILASHNTQYQMWGEPGVTASDGVKEFTEV